MISVPDPKKITIRICTCVTAYNIQVFETPWVKAMAK
jgi:hypothetical protein